MPQNPKEVLDQLFSDFGVVSYCGRCACVLTEENSQKRYDGRKPSCKACHNKWKNAYRIKTGRAKENWLRLKRMYGVGEQEFEILWQKQLGLCGICLNMLTRKPMPQIDHCHVTGIVRGLLCTNCNLGLGSFKENTATLNRAIEYLAKGGL